jgi:hypothetical protein
MTGGDNINYLVNYLDAQSLEAVLRLRVGLELSGGHYTEAKAALDDLKKKVGPLKADDPLAVGLGQFSDQIKLPNPLVVPGKLLPWSDDEAKGIWTYILFRKTISFKDVTGRLDHMHLTCDGQTIDSAVSAEMQWSTQDDPSKCTLIVFGSPGASFSLVQSN